MSQHRLIDQGGTCEITYPGVHCDVYFWRLRLRENVGRDRDATRDDVGGQVRVRMLEGCFDGLCLRVDLS
jgi:hypothetical protein